MTQAATRETLLRADDRRYALTVSADVDALEQLLTDDFTYTHNAGFTDGKSAYLQRIRTGTVRYSDASRISENTRIHGATGIITGHMRMLAILADKTVQLDNLFLAAWIYTDHGWKLAAWSSTTRGS